MIRSISYNVFGGKGYKGINGHELPPGEDSILVKAAREMGQIPKRIALELALYRPNIINFSESPREDVVAAIAETLNCDYVFFPGGNSGCPGSILTNYEIISSENEPLIHQDGNHSKKLFTRHWGKAKLRLPDGKNLTVHSAHLRPFRKSPDDTEIRLAEIKEILDAVQDDIANGSDSVLLQGDLNHVPDTPEYEALINGGLMDAFCIGGQGDGYTINSIIPTRRIDYIFCAGELSQQRMDCKVLFEGNFRMNTEDPKGYALSDHLPVLADFEQLENLS